jgi:HEAT repeat protein
MGHDEKRYPMSKIMGTAELASGLDPGAAGELTRRLTDPDSAVRYWAAMGLLMRGAVDGLRKALSDSSPNVRAVAAEALGRYGSAEDLKQSLAVLMELAPADKNGAYVSLLALTRSQR